MANWLDCCPKENQKIIKLCLVLLAIVVLALAVTFSTISFAVNPHIKANVEDARLNTFAFAVDVSGTTASFFNYNLSVALTIRNPNKVIGIKYSKPLVAVVAFHDRRIRNFTVLVNGYKQGRGKVKHIVLPIAGKISSDLLGDAVADDFKKQNATGLFNLELRLSGQMIKDHPFALHRKHELGMSCPLRLQLAPPGPEVVVFHEVNCKPDKPDKIYF